MAGKYRLTKLNLAEISLVSSGDDPEAAIVISKADPDIEKACSHKHKKGDKCDMCGKIVKAMPTGSDTYVKSPLGSGFKHQKRMKKKKAAKLVVDRPESFRDDADDKPKTRAR